MRTKNNSFNHSPASITSCGRTARFSLAALFLSVFLVPHALAQNLDGMLRGVLQRQLSNSVNSAANSAFRSISDLVTGQAPTAVTQSQDTEGKVILYRTAWCGYCRKAASYMQRNNIPFVERDIERSPQYRDEYTRLGGTGGVPFMRFGTKTLGGYSEKLISAYYREMHAAGDVTSRHAASEPESPPLNGDNLDLRLSTLNVHSSSSTSSAVISTLTPADRLIYLGEERDGLYRIASDKGEGWVDKRLVRSRRTP